MRMMHVGYGRAASCLFLLLCSLFLGVGAAVRAQSGNLMVADFEGTKVETNDGLALIVMADEQIGGTSGAQMSLLHAGAHNSRGALHIVFRITNDFRAPFDGVWALLGKEGLATDLTAYRGVRFYARSKGGTFLAGAGQFSGRTGFYLAPFETGQEWTLVELPFDKFKRVTPAGAPVADAPAFVAKDLVSLAFNVSSQLRGEFDLDIDQVEFYR